MFDATLHSILTVLFVAIGAGVLGLIAQTMIRLNLRLSAEQQAKLDYYVQQAIQFAEEKVEAMVKIKAQPIKEKAGAKLNEAIVYLMDKVPGIDLAKANELVTAGLGSSPFGASKSW
jgi:hypothetical protein